MHCTQWWCFNEGAHAENPTAAQSEQSTKSRENSPNEKKIVDEFINNLGLSLSLIINIIDPDAIVFGGGVSNEIQSLEEVKIITEKYLSEFNNIKKVDLKTVFLKPKYGDASGVRGAAILNRQNLI